MLTNIKDNEAKTWKLALTRTFEEKSPSGKRLKMNRVVSSLLTNDVGLYRLPNKLNKLRSVVVLSKRQQRTLTVPVIMMNDCSNYEIKAILDS